MHTSKSFDHLNRLTRTGSMGAGAQPLLFDYTYNPANQRTNVVLADGSHWAYGYDHLGQVTSGKKHWADNQAVAGQQFEYGFDDIGNRTTTQAGGQEDGTGLRSAAYQVNAANQYTSREVPGAVDVLGVASGTVSVNESADGMHRRGDYFWKEWPVANVGAPVWANLTVRDSGGSNFRVLHKIEFTIL